MTNKEFLNTLLGSQNLSEGQENELSSHRGEVETYLREKFGSEPKIKYAGSKAKGTMIAENYDLDIICYFPNTNNQTLKEIHDEVEKTLSSNYTVERKATAIRIKKTANDAETDYHIDVVPGRYIDESDTDAFLHVVYGEKERMQTNIDTHISYIKDSGFQDIIKLLKLWKVRNKVPLKTFILEILTVNTLKGVPDKMDHENNFKKVLLSLKNEIKSMRIEDPANSNNIVSDGMDDASKDVVALKATEALDLLDESTSSLEAWQSIFIGDNLTTAKAISQGAFYAGTSGISAKIGNLSNDERKIQSPKSWRE